MKEMFKIIDQDYEKISDLCMWLSNEYVLKFNVELNKRNTKYGKQNYYKEFGYIADNEFRVNIARDFNYYLSIESIKRAIDGSKLQLRIGINDIYFFKHKLQEVVAWFTSREYKSLFVKKDGRIIIPVRVEPIIVDIMFNNYIEFEPAIITLDNQEQIIGVRIYLNSDAISFFMNVNTLLSFAYFIDTFNMYQSAQLLLNYLGRPENGTNYNEFQQHDNQNHSSGFFNRVNAERKD